MKLHGLLGAVLMAATIPHVQAQQGGSTAYPNRPIRYIVPFPPGGSADGIARIIAQQMTQVMGQQWLVDNRPGADGVLAANIVIKAAPDGYTTFLGTNTPMSAAPALRKVPPYDPVKDFEPISKVSSYMFFVVAHPSLPARNVKSLISLAKAKPGEIPYASVGVGSGTHLAGELFGHMAGVRLAHIPYKGTGQVMPDLLGGQIALTFGSTSVVPHVKQGKLYALGVTGARRSAVLPEVPTVAESGIPGYEVTAWNALFAPAGTPMAILARLNELTRKNIAQSEAKSVMDAQGLDGDTGTSAELAALVKTELAKWARVIKVAGIKPE